MLLTAVTVSMPLMTIAIPYLCGRIADSFETDGRIDITLAFWACLSTVFAVALRVMQSKENFKRIGYGLFERLGVAVLEKLSNSSLAQISDGGEGRRESIKKGQDAVRDLLSMIFTEVLPIAFLLVITVLSLTMVHWLVASVVVACLVGFVGAGIKINCDVIDKVQDYDREENRVDARFWERAANMRLIILSNQGRRAIGEFRAEYAGYARKGESLWFGYIWRTLLQRDVFCVMSMILVLIVSLRLMQEHKLAPSQFIVVMVWTYSAFSSMFSMGSLQRRLMESWSRVVDFVAFFESPSYAAKAKGRRRIDSFEGIRVQSVSFSHSRSPIPGVPILQDVSLDLRPGQFCAVVGPSGSGKTTIVNTMIGAHEPKDGRVLINGIDMNLIDLRSFWRFVGLVEQRPIFFSSMSIGENLDFAQSGRIAGYSLERKYDMLRSLCLDSFCDERRLAEPIDRVSGGERQRLAIARALLAEPRLLVLDEATSALDAKNEIEVLLAIKETAVMQGMTVLAVAHRVATAEIADRVVFVKEGKIVATGQHDDLIARNREYHALFMSQILAERAEAKQALPLSA